MTTVLLPTPQASDGLFEQGPMCSGRSVAESTFLATRVLVLPLPGRMDESEEARRDQRQKEKKTRMKEHRLLPTPTSRDGKGANQQHTDSCLPVAVEHYLPTPVSRDGGKGGAVDPDRKKASGHAVTLQDVTEKTGLADAWGDYGPAIHRWEQALDRPSPCPTQASGSLLKALRRLSAENFRNDWLREHVPGWTEGDRIDETLWGRVPGDNGSGDLVIPATSLPSERILRFWLRGVKRKPNLTCLSPMFVEWMMGLDPGTVTDPRAWEHVDLNHRNLQLRALGNGVVPQQAAAAIQWALAVRRTLA